MKRVCPLAPLVCTTGYFDCIYIKNDSKFCSNIYIYLGMIQLVIYANIGGGRHSVLPPVTAERQTYCSPVYVSNGHLAGLTLWSPGESTGDRKIWSASAAGSSAIPVLFIRTNSYTDIPNTSHV